MLTGHMMDLLPVFINEAVWNKISEGPGPYQPTIKD